MGGLRHAIGLYDWDLKYLFQRRHHLRRQCSGRGADEAERTARDESTVALSPWQDGLMHGGHRGVPGRMKGFHPLKEGGHIKPGGTHHTGPSRERRKRRTNETVDVKERHDIQ